MALQILGSPSNPDEVVDQLREAIARDFPQATIEVRASGGAHFEISVTSECFEGQSRLAQQQAVYAAIAHLMKGTNPAVHAIDKLETRVE